MHSCVWMPFGKKCLIDCYEQQEVPRPSQMSHGGTDTGTQRLRALKSPGAGRAGQAQ